MSISHHLKIRHRILSREISLFSFFLGYQQFQIFKNENRICCLMQKEQKTKIFCLTKAISELIKKKNRGRNYFLL